MARTQSQSVDAALQTALRVLAARPRSIAEVRTRLSRRFPREITEEAIRTLEERGLLDDAKFAAAWQESRSRTKPRSAALVRRELEQRGVARPLADAAVAGMDDERAAEQIARRRASQLASADYRSFVRRLGGYLLRRGFSPALSRRVVAMVAAERAGEDSVSVDGS